ncbi:unnamed protein product [Caenorhabditis sp. 36 PRJEB53466]|nr:unnamed protein product [Caenorhabditis sp. 36 PRJEB53466]
MGQNSSKVCAPSIPVAPQLSEPSRPVTPSFGRAQTMLDVSQALAASGANVDGAGLQRSSSDTALNTSFQASGPKVYQQKTEDWGRKEHFLKLAHAFHTNNY